MILLLLYFLFICPSSIKW